MFRVVVYWYKLLCMDVYTSFVDGSPDGLPFAVICLLVRVVEALGAAALVTSSFAIIANTFPDSITAMFVRTTAVLSDIGNKREQAA